MNELPTTLSPPSSTVVSIWKQSNETLLSQSLTLVSNIWNSLPSIDQYVDIPKELRHEYIILKGLVFSAIELKGVSRCTGRDKAIMLLKDIDDCLDRMLENKWINKESLKNNIYDMFDCKRGLYEIQSKIDSLEALHPDYYEYYNANSKLMAEFMSPSQLATISKLAKKSNEEYEYFRSVIADLSLTMEYMPQIYSQDNLEINPTAGLHYFLNGTDWFITERDCEDDQIQAFGYTIINGDMQNAEFGYINIQELARLNAEIDLHFTPAPMQDIIRNLQAKLSINHSVSM